MIELSTIRPNEKSAMEVTEPPNHSTSPYAIRMIVRFGLMVLSSIIAAWADIKHALESYGTSTSEATARISTLNAGYIWMLANCLCTAAYVLGMRKRIKLTNFKDFDSKFHSVMQRKTLTH